MNRTEWPAEVDFDAWEREEEAQLWLTVTAARSYEEHGRWWARLTLSCGHEQLATLAEGRVRCTDWVGVLAQCQHGCRREVE